MRSKQYSFVCLAAIGLSLCVMVPVSAGAITIQDFIGDVSVAPVEIGNGLDVVRDVENVNGTLHIAGWMQNTMGVDAVAARQLIDLSSGTAGSVELFQSLSGATNPRGQIQDVLIRADGSVEYVGTSMSPDASQTGRGEGTVWSDPSTPVGIGVASGGESVVFSGTANGVYVGYEAGRPSMGTLDSGWSLLPVSDYGAAIDISGDGRYIVGYDTGVPVFWEEMALGTYDLRDDVLETPENAMLYCFLWSVIDDIAFGEYFSLTSFQTGIAAWDLSTGALLQDFGLGEFADAELIDGQIVVGMNGVDGGRLSLLGDPSSLLLSELMGIDDLTLARGGLYEGSLGIFAQGAQGTMVTTSYQTNGTVPEPSTFVIMLTGMLTMGLFRKFRLV